MGMGSVALVRALGLLDREIYHMNEGHSALLTLSLLESQWQSEEGCSLSDEAVETVRQKCGFPTNTPVSAGHDQFPWELVKQVLSQDRAHLLKITRGCVNGNLNMTYLALRFARYINGVAIRHGEILVGMFPGYPVDKPLPTACTPPPGPPRLLPTCLTGVSLSGVGTISTCVMPSATPSMK